jgi:hypothetical protein
MMIAFLNIVPGKRKKKENLLNHLLLFWFSHFIVPELGPDVNFSYASHKAVTEYKEAKAVSALVLPFICRDFST